MTLNSKTPYRIAHSRHDEPRIAPSGLAMPRSPVLSRRELRGIVADMLG